VTVGVLLSVVGLLQGGYAMWLANRAQEKADQLNRETLKLLIELKTQTDILTKYAMPELGKWGDFGRRMVGAGTVNAPSASLGNSPPASSASVALPGSAEQNSGESNAL